MKSVIIRNAAKCRLCGDEIESLHSHDWVSCSCGAIFVDGGTSYLRNGGARENFEPLYEVIELSDDEYRQHIMNQEKARKQANLDYMLNDLMSEQEIFKEIIESD